MGRHNWDASAWLAKKIKGMEVLSFTDAQILDNLESSMGTLACAAYTQMLKESCDSFSRGYFTANYQELADLDYKVTSKEEYLVLLQRLDEEVGRHNSLGEIKSYVLLQMLAMTFGEQIYVFCSDDKNARNGVSNFEGVSCISILSVFLRLKKETGWELADAEPYITSLVDFCTTHNQMSFRVMEASDVSRMCRVPCRQVLEEVFHDRFIELKNGVLKYRP